MKSSVSPISTWLTANEAQLQIPNTVWELLRHDGSLTQHLRYLTHNEIEHRLLFANWGHATPAERRALQLDTNERTWIRHIEWRYRGALWIYARTIFSETVIKKTQEMIPGLGIQPLGDLIFKDPNLTRDPFTFCWMNEANVCYPHTAWARRSILHFQHQPILVTEVFLPESYAEHHL